VGDTAIQADGRDGAAWPRVLLVIFLLYLFLVGVKGLEDGIQGLGSGFTERIVEGVSNPLAGLFAGILITVLVQSSSVSTATIVGLVGAGTLPLSHAVPMIMGANLGTTVTNTLVSVGYMRGGREFRRAFAGATMHDFFNLISVVVLLPLELTTRFLSRSAVWITGLLRDSPTVGAGPGASPIKTAVAYPVGIVSDALEAAGLSPGVVGVTLLVIGIAAIFVALAFVTRTMKDLLVGRIERSLNAVLAKGAGTGAMAVGVVTTVLVQSSSITTSILVPLIAAGVLTLPNAFPVTLGANIGTTITALLASLATARPEGLTIALVHLLFNLTGILIVYPVGAVRRIPVALATGLARAVDTRRQLAAVYVVGGFIVVPLVGLFLLG
jgi:solute carrier family 34 (sodium-dependent phosphate cotransporter)